MSVRTHLSVALVRLLVVTVLAGCAGWRGGPSGPPASPSDAATARPTRAITEHRDLAYGPADPGNRLDLFVPTSPGGAPLPLIIWHSGSGWSSDAIKDEGEEDPIVGWFTAHGFAVASINIRSSHDIRFPAQGHDVRAAIRFLRTAADAYGLDPERFAFMGDSSGGWAAAFAATTSDELGLPGESKAPLASSAVQVAVAFFPPTDLLSMDTFADTHGLPMAGDAYPHDGPLSREGYLIHCPGEGSSEGYPVASSLVSIQMCPEAAAAADPATYVEGMEVPMWLIHGLADSTVPYDQSQSLYDATVAEGNAARLTLVPSRGHAIEAVLNAPEATTWTAEGSGRPPKATGLAPTWVDIEQFLLEHLH